MSQKFHWNQVHNFLGWTISILCLFLACGYFWQLPAPEGWSAMSSINLAALGIVLSPRIPIPVWFKALVAYLGLLLLLN